MPAAQPGFRPKPIGVYLSLLVALIVAPALIFALVLLDRTGEAQREVLETLAATTAGSISEGVDREIIGMLTTLRVLSTAESLRVGNLGSFYGRARAALRDRDAYVIVLDGEDNQLLNTRVPFGTELGKVSEPFSVAAARDGGQGIVSNAFFGRTSQRWVFNVILPLPDVEDGRHVLIMSQDAENLTSALSQHNLRGGWNVSLVDQLGIVLASSYMSADIGQPFFLGNDVTSGRVRGQLGDQSRSEEFSVVSQRSQISGWKVVVWASADAIDAPLRRSMLILLAGGIVVALFAAGAAWAMARQIARPIRRLARDARRLGAGEEVKSIDYPIAEIATVSAAMAQASTDRRAAESEIRFLMREVAHRSKNQLTVVSSIAKQTARSAPSFEAFQDSLQKRLLGLARSTDLLIAGGAAGVELRELLAAQIEPFQPADAARVELEGAPFRLANQAAQTIGLAVHELATNAAKYGAFSTAAGRLHVSWKTNGEVLDLTWREIVPGLEKRPEGKGFGTQVIERMVGGTLDAEIDRNLHDDGLECRFRIPIEKVGARAHFMPGE